MKRNNSILIGKYIKRFITDDTTIMEKIHGQVYPLYANQDTVYPYIVYARTGLNVNYSKDGQYRDLVTITVIVCSDDYGQSIDIANDVRHCFEFGSYKDENICINNIRLTNANESSFDGGYIQTLTLDFDIS